VDQLNIGDLEVLELRPSQPQSNKPKRQELTGEVVLRRPLGGGSDRVVIHSADGRRRIDARATDSEVLQRVLDAGRQAITWVAQSRDERLVVHAHFFGESGMPDEEFTIGVDDRIAERIRDDLHIARTSFDKVRDWLMDELTLPALDGSGAVRVVHSSTPIQDGAPQQRAFTLLGWRWAADIANRDGKFQVTRLVEVSRRRSDRWPRLSRVALSFVDAGEQVEASEALQAALAGLLEEGRSYIELWRAYDQLEKDVLINDALDLGVPRYRGWRFNPDETWNFSLVPDRISQRFLRRLQQRNETIELEAAEDPPGELTGGGRSGRTVRGTVRESHPEDWSLDVKPASRARQRMGDPPHQGVLFLALTGSRVSQERRARARDRIWSGNAEMRGLARLIEGVGIIPREPRSIARYRKALERVIRSSFTGGSPTDSQGDALVMALRTPDVLLVQGPPGTGKTQFITALLRCLDAVGESVRVFNRTLITSYQNEAVDHLVSKARNRGLPPSRVDSDEKRGRLSAQQLRAEIVQRVERHLEGRPGVERRQRLRDLQTLVASYDNAPSASGDLVEILNQVERLAGNAVPPALKGRLARLRAEIEMRAKAARTLFIAQHAVAVRTARSLRGTPGGFADDGLDRARCALPVLDELRLLDDGDRELLERAAAWDEPAEPPFLADLAALQIRLLERLGSDSTAISPVPARDPDVQILLHEIVAEAERHFGGQPESVEGVLADYLAGLNGNVALIQKTLDQYNAVLASTVQQVDSLAMHRIVDAPLPVFGTVIVDEAARANPLDLMIPMACARDRIILVGDHKQLPHAMERRLERELERTGRVTDTSDLRQSLFQRWFDTFSGSENPSVRTITLNEQFRMHPELGRFVSKVFYGSPEAVKAHLSTHGLTNRLEPYPGKVAGWINVSYDGRETRENHSFVRPHEARRLVQELKDLADQDTDRLLTFGVISFYKSQIAAIREALLDVELLVPDDEETDSFKPVPRMEWTAEPRPRRRLQIGTVDAFQGMEFDVVLLSVTRSNLPHEDEGMREALRRYGHMVSEQRMCVAMSRQRRLLLAVGDAAMADRATAPTDPTDRNRSLVEGLVAFLELCKGEHGAGVRL
jgi:hypothetical protein